MGFHGICVTANTPELEKRKITANIKKIFDGNCQYFIHTPTISVGVDFNVNNKVDYVVRFFNTRSDVTVETCHQMLRRPRNVNERTYLLHVKDRFSNLPTTEESLKEWLCDQDQMIRGGTKHAEHLPYDGSADFKLTLEDTLYARLYLISKITKNLSKNDFVGRLIQQIKDAGGAIQGIDKPTKSDLKTSLNKDIEQFKSDIQANEDEKIASAPNIGFLEYEELRNRQGSSHEQESDKYHIRRFYLQRMYNLQDNFIITSDWVRLFNSEKEISVFQNLCRIQDGIETSMEYEQAQERETLDHMDSDTSKTVQSIDQRAESTYTRLRYATNMLLICGFNNAFSKDKIPRNVIENNINQAWPEIVEKLDMICTTLDIPKPTSNNLEFRHQICFLSRVLKNVLSLTGKATYNHRQLFKLEHTSNVGKYLFEMEQTGMDKKKGIELGLVFRFWNE